MRRVIVLSSLVSLLVGLAPISASAEVSPYPEDAPYYTQDSPYYTQFRDVSGITVKASSVVDPRALDVAAQVVEEMFRGRHDIRRRLVEQGAALAIIPKDSLVTELPEFAWLSGKTTPDGRSYDSLRGLGAVRGQPVSATAEENLLGQWRLYSLAHHEFGHAVMNLGFTGDDLRRWTKIFDVAVEIDTFPGRYAMTDQFEYFAELTASYFSVNSGLGGPSVIQSVDPAAFTFLDEVFGYRGKFFDDDNSIFENAIEWLADEGITKGCNPPFNSKYCPRDFVTRGEMAVFLVRAMGYTDNGGGNLFIDDNDMFYENSADRLKTAKVTLGCNPPTNNKFCGSRHVTRGEMAAFLVRAMSYTDNGGGNLFVDDDGHLFENAIDKLGAAKVTLGCNPPVNDKFCPNDFVTRGQMAAFLKRALG